MDLTERNQKRPDREEIMRERSVIICAFRQMLSEMALGFMPDRNTSEAMALLLEEHIRSGNLFRRTLSQEFVYSGAVLFSKPAPPSTEEEAETYDLRLHEHRRMEDFRKRLSETTREAAAENRRKRPRRITDVLAQNGLGSQLSVIVDMAVNESFSHSQSFHREIITYINEHVDALYRGRTDDTIAEGFEKAIAHRSTDLDELIAWKQTQIALIRERNGGDSAESMKLPKAELDALLEIRKKTEEEIKKRREITAKKDKAEREKMMEAEKKEARDKAEKKAEEKSSSAREDLQNVGL